MPIRKELLDELLKECERPEDMLGPDGLLKQLTAPWSCRSIRYRDKNASLPSGPPSAAARRSRA